jgi:hypothetical protein
MDKISEQEKTDLEAERAELNMLVQRGVRFEVSIKVRKQAKGLKGFFGKKEISEETIPFEIQEPTLSVLDRISDIALEMAINEEEFKEGSQGDVISNARKAVQNNAKKLARVVAIAALGEDYHVTGITKSGKIKRRNDDKELDRLTALFFHAIKPSKLAMITSTITSISGLGDFLASIQLLSGARTTQPIKNRIE